jgi:hypothetical protein
VSTPRFRLRIVDYDQAELWCNGCSEWLPVTMEFWPSRSSFWRCRACDRERTRLYELRRLADPEYRMVNVTKSKLYRARLRGENTELLEAELRERRERYAASQRRRRDAARRAYKREWMRRKRAELLTPAVITAFQSDDDPIAMAS